MSNKIGICEHCHKEFKYELIHDGFSEMNYLYCDSCGMTAFFPGLDICKTFGYSSQAELPGHGVLEKKYADLLTPCPCGGTFSGDASPRCPHCLKPLSAKKATKYIQSKKNKYIWKLSWGESWKGRFFLVIEGKEIKNNWDKEKVIKFFAP
jgi:hypothetical protein